MSNFECTYAQLRDMAGDYLKQIRKPEITLEALDAGHKCVALHYLGMKTEYDHEVAGAAALMRIITREYLDVDLGLTNTVVF